MNFLTPNQIEEIRPRFFKFLASANPVTGCIPYMGARAPFGYGSFSIDGMCRQSSRVAWMLSKGEIPEGKFVCHHCDNPPCCNPNHLFIGDTSENYWDSVHKNRMPIGSNHPSSKLKEFQVREILKSTDSTESLGRKYKVNPSTIRGIRRRKYWKHLQIN